MTRCAQGMAGNTCSLFGPPELQRMLKGSPADIAPPKFVELTQRHPQSDPRNSFYAFFRPSNPSSTLRSTLRTSSHSTSPHPTCQRLERSLSAPQLSPLVEASRRTLPGNGYCRFEPYMHTGLDYWALWVATSDIQIPTSRS